MCYLQTKAALLKRVGIDKIPGANTLARWLRHHGHAGVGLINQLNQQVIATTLQLSQVKEVTLDIDATVIATEKASATWTYLRCQGYTMMVGTLAEVGQVIAAQLRDGYVSPNLDNMGFIQACRKLLPSGTILKRVRIDAAGYQHKVIDYLIAHQIEFVIRVAMNSLIAKAIDALPEPAWQPLRLGNGSLSLHDQVARCTHMMYRSTLVFDLIIQRTRRSKVSKSSRTKKLLGLLNYNPDKYEYRVIATNIKQLDNSEIVHLYNQRGEHSENRIKELKSDFAAGRPPCSDFAANALYVCVCALSFNVFALMRNGLPAGMRHARALILRPCVFDLARKIVCHGRQWKLKLPTVYFS